MPAEARPTIHMERLPAAAERYEQAARLKDEGLTHKQIGEKFGVGEERAQQLVKLGREFRGNARRSILPPRAVNVLWLSQTIKDRDDLDPQKIAQVSAKELLREPNCGKGTIADINQWLSQHGLSLQP